MQSVTKKSRVQVSRVPIFCAANKSSAARQEKFPLPCVRSRPSPHSHRPGTQERLGSISRPSAWFGPNKIGPSSPFLGRVLVYRSLINHHRFSE